MWRREREGLVRLGEGGGDSSIADRIAWEVDRSVIGMCWTGGEGEGKKARDG